MLINTSKGYRHLFLYAIFMKLLERFVFYIIMSFQYIISDFDL